MSTSIIGLERRARNYWNADGLPVVVGGVCYVLLGLSLLPDWLFPALALAVSVLALHTFSYFAVNWLKSRVTYPRTGYVVASEPPTSLIEGHFISLNEADTLEAQRHAERDRVHRQHLIRVAVAFAIVCLFSMVGAFVEDHGVFSKAAVMCVVAFAVKPPVYRFSPLELAGCPLFALLIAWLPAPQHRHTLMFVAIGMLSLLRGFVALLRYLHKNPTPS